MKNVLSGFLTFVIVFTAILFAGSLNSVAAQSTAAPSNKELKALLASARTPAEHRIIASLYSRQAEEYTQKSAEHSAMAVRFATAAASQSKQSIQGVIHCRYFAKYYREQAKKAAALASTHEQTATIAASR